MCLVGNYRVIGSDRCPGAFQRDPTSMLINIVYKHGRFAYAHNAPAQVNWGFKIYGGADGTRENP